MVVLLPDAIRRLRVAAQGCDIPENRGRMVPDRNSGGYTIRIGVADLAALLDDYDRLDAMMRAEERFQRGRNDARGDV